MDAVAGVVEASSQLSSGGDPSLSLRDPAGSGQEMFEGHEEETDEPD